MTISSWLSRTSRMTVTLDHTTSSLTCRHCGHVEIGDHVTIGATPVHQFCRVGNHVCGRLLGSCQRCDAFARSVGNHAHCYGANALGLRRKGFSTEQVRHIEHAFHLLLSSKLNTSQALERIRSEMNGIPEIDYLVDFIESSKRGVIK